MGSGWRNPGGGIQVEGSRWRDLGGGSRWWDLGGGI